MINKKDVTIVTCMYYDLHDTDLNGRAAVKARYICGLRNLLTSGVNVILITSSSHIQDVNELYSSYDNLTIVSQELHDLPIYKKIYDLKNKSNLEGMRCYEIMYSKINWMYQYSNLTTYTIWMDVGLFHIGIFPPDLLSDLGNTHCDKYFHYDILTDELLNKIVCQDQVRVCAFDQSNILWSSYGDRKYFNNDPKSMHVVGAIISSDRHTIIKLNTMFENTLHKCIADYNLYTEEQIYTILANNYNEMFDVWLFNYWQYESHPDYLKNIMAALPVENRKPFYKLFV